jgi:hypothetical protein
MKEWYWQAKTEELGEKHVPLPLCPPQIPHGLTGSRTWPPRSETGDWPPEPWHGRVWLWYLNIENIATIKVIVLWFYCSVFEGNNTYYIHYLYSSLNIFTRVIKWKMTKRRGKITYEEGENASISIWKAKGKRSPRKATCIWENNVKLHLK